MKSRAVFTAIIIIPIALILAAAMKTSVYHVSTPELFGDGTAYMVRVGAGVLGYVDAWGGWVLYGSVENCRLVQVAGDPINDVSGPVACYMEFRKLSRFTGWIDFRGHRRKFCGASSPDNVPPKCYGE